MAGRRSTLPRPFKPADGVAIATGNSGWQMEDKAAPVGKPPWHVWRLDFVVSFRFGIASERLPQQFGLSLNGRVWASELYEVDSLVL